MNTSKSHIGELFLKACPYCGCNEYPTPWVVPNLPMNSEDTQPLMNYQFYCGTKFMVRNHQIEIQTESCEDSLF